MPDERYAHSVPGQPLGNWEPLATHLLRVGARSAEFAGAFGLGQMARAAGLLHDIGKAAVAYQAYIAGPLDPSKRGPDHSTAGAREAHHEYGPSLGKLLAFAIAGHHAGLGNGSDLARRLDPERHAIESYQGWQRHAGELPAPTVLAKERAPTQGPEPGFTTSFMTRMLFSCLVDADFLETEKFYAGARGESPARDGFTSIATLQARLHAHMAEKSRIARATPVNATRAHVLQAVMDKSAMPPGLFTLTVPTGGGKTLASLSFALCHAVRHGLRRAVYVIPFTSIIEQTASVFRSALSADGDVLEHHSSFDWEPQANIDDEGQDGLRKLQRAAENWDAPIVVTTAVQFFESLFAARPSRCRKLHNLAKSVIILDEAQTMPVPLLRPSLAALDELARNYGATVILCTATQPAVRIADAAMKDDKGRSLGLDIPPERELAPDPPALYSAMQRVTVELNGGETSDSQISLRFAEQPQMLCIVNSRAHARTLFESIKLLPGAVHLSTLMCPLHRRDKLANIRDRLSAGKPVRLVSTSLIEAGVDVDFPEVWRAASGLDAIAQAAGRCNREGRAEKGRVVVFVPVEAKMPWAFTAFWQAAQTALRRHAADPLSLEANHAYFRELYWTKGIDALDAAEVDGRPGILKSINERANDLSFDFKHIAHAYRLIDDIMAPVIVPWKSDEDDVDAANLLRKIAASDRPTRADLRRLQLYTVGIPPKARQFWLERGALAPVHVALGDALLHFADTTHYRAETGLDLSNQEQRAAEANII